ncbi:hypothetical protein [Streptomyces paludis]|uniref:hypothetical protein n=1 Tax=Streptomyces paludis TaxID=2282738 RepID=UPI001E3F7C19|nr:hypothetical protein [Streptomyces paludis]
MQRLPERIDLVRYRIFEGGLLSLLLVDSSPGFPTAASSRRNREREAAVDVAAAAPVAPSPADASLVPKCLRDLYAEVDDALTAWGEVEDPRSRRRALPETSGKVRGALGECVLTCTFRVRVARGAGYAIEGVLLEGGILGCVPKSA